MLYKKFYAGKFLLLKKTLSLILLLSFSLTVFSCTTTEISNCTPDEFIQKRKGNTKELTQITTFTEKLDIVDNNVQYLHSAADSAGYLSFKKADTVVVRGQGGFKLRVTQRKIPLRDILNLQFSDEEFDAGKTLVYTGLTVVGIIAIITILLLIFPPRIGIGMSGSLGK